MTLLTVHDLTRFTLTLPLLLLTLTARRLSEVSWSSGVAYLRTPTLCTPCGQLLDVGLICLTKTIALTRRLVTSAPALLSYVLNELFPGVTSMRLRGSMLPVVLWTIGLYYVLSISYVLLLTLWTVVYTLAVLIGLLDLVVGRLVPGTQKLAMISVPWDLLEMKWWVVPNRLLCVNATKALSLWLMLRVVPVRTSDIPGH